MREIHVVSIARFFACRGGVVAAKSVVVDVRETWAVEESTR